MTNQFGLAERLLVIFRSDLELSIDDILALFYRSFIKSRQLVYLLLRYNYRSTRNQSVTERCNLSKDHIGSTCNIECGSLHVLTLLNNNNDMTSLRLFRKCRNLRFCSLPLDGGGVCKTTHGYSRSSLNLLIEIVFL